MLTESKEERLKAGNLNTTPTLATLQQIASQNRGKFDLDKDFVVFMLKLIEDLKTKAPGKYVNGYIRFRNFHCIRFR